MDFSIPDEPDTDSIWDRMGNEWQRKVYNTKKVWKCVETESVRSWIGLLNDFGPLTDAPPVPKVGDILTEKTAFRLPSGSIVMADRSVAINKVGIAFYFGDSCLPTWDALQRYVRYEPIRVVRVGWSS
jgi:hypothetical protein